MNRNVTASFSLSVSLVVLFAILLYQPDGPVPPSLQASPLARAETLPSTPDLDRSRPEPTPGIPLTETLAVDAMSHEPSPSPALPAEAVVIEAVGDHSRPSREGRAQGTRPDAVPALPSPAFTYAKPGESLADIAVRVYGTPNSARKVWMANRDLIDSLDAIPPGGALLRTP